MVLASVRSVRGWRHEVVWNENGQYKRVFVWQLPVRPMSPISSERIPLGSVGDVGLAPVESPDWLRAKMISMAK